MSETPIRLHEWESLLPDKGSPLYGIHLETEHARQCADALTKSGRLVIQERPWGLEIGATSYVGKVSLDRLTIEIRPKIRESSILNLLRYAYGFRHLEIIGKVSQSVDATLFQDILVYQLLEEVTELLARGLHRDYKRFAEDLSNPRGRPDFLSQVRRGGIVDGRLSCVFYQHCDDVHINRVLLAGIDLAYSVAFDRVLREQARSVRKVLTHSISPTDLNHEIVVSEIKSLNRRTRSYAAALDILRLLIEATGTVFGNDGSRIVIPGFLFDMNRFFQALVAKFLHGSLQDDVVQSEQVLYGLYSYASGGNPLNRRSPSPRPDIVIRRGQVIQAILDAKYRDLWEHSLPRDMLYQLSVYALGNENQRNAVIIYPTTSRQAREQVLQIHHPLSGTRIGTVRLRPLSLDYLDALLSQGDSQESLAERKRYAEHIGYGSSREGGAAGNLPSPHVRALKGTTVGERVQLS